MAGTAFAPQHRRPLRPGLRIEQELQRLPKLAQSLRSQDLLPPPLRIERVGAHHPKRLAAPWRQLDDSRTSVSRVRRPQDIPVAFQCGYRLGHRLPTHPKPVGQVRRMQAPAGQWNEADRLCRPDPIESGRGERRPQPGSRCGRDQLHQGRHRGLPRRIQNTSHDTESAIHDTNDKMLVKYAAGCHHVAVAVRCAQVVNVCLLAALIFLANTCVVGTRLSATPDFPIPAGRSVQILNSGGIFRIYRVYRPRGLTGAAPLVVMLHGGFGDGAPAQRDYHWNSQADTGGFVVAYPNGVLRAWNGGTCCGAPESFDIDDVGFITDMVATIQRRTPIDPARAYATGMSAGAIMALRLGCQSDKFAAIAPVAGTLLTDCAHARPTSVLQIHGTADDRVPYNGGPGAARSFDGTARVDGPSAAAVNATWRAIDACAPPTSTTSGVVTTQTASCTDARRVTLISVAGAGHQWPGSRSKPVLETIAGISPPSTALDATATIWQFFSQAHL